MPQAIEEDVSVGENLGYTIPAPIGSHVPSFGLGVGETPGMIEERRDSDRCGSLGQAKTAVHSRSYLRATLEPVEKKATVPSAMSPATNAWGISYPIRVNAAMPRQDPAVLNA